VIRLRMYHRTRYMSLQYKFINPFHAASQASESSETTSLRFVLGLVPIGALFQGADDSIDSVGDP